MTFKKFDCQFEFNKNEIRTDLFLYKDIKYPCHWLVITNAYDNYIVFIYLFIITNTQSLTFSKHECGSQVGNRSFFHSIKMSSIASVLFTHWPNFSNFLWICFGFAIHTWNFDERLMLLFDFLLFQQVHQFEPKKNRSKKVVTLFYSGICTPKKHSSNENYDNKIWWDTVLITLSLFLFFFYTKKMCSGIGYWINETVKAKNNNKTRVTSTNRQYAYRVRHDFHLDRIYSKSCSKTYCLIFISGS